MDDSSRTDKEFERLKSIPTGNYSTEESLRLMLAGMYRFSEILEKELAEARDILKQCLSIMPVGYIPTHTVENLPEMISDLAKALAEETTEREQLERELAEARELCEMQSETMQQMREKYGLGERNVMRELRKQRDTLAEAMTKYMDHHMRYGFVTAVENYKVEQALAAVKGGQP